MPAYSERIGGGQATIERQYRTAEHRGQSVLLLACSACPDEPAMRAVIATIGLTLSAMVAACAREATLTTLATFTGSNGANRYTGLIADAAGNLCGTTNRWGSTPKAGPHPDYIQASSLMWFSCNRDGAHACRSEFRRDENDAQTEHVPVNRWGPAFDAGPYLQIKGDRGGSGGRSAHKT